MTPLGDWSNLLVLAGRGFGKTRLGAEDVAHFGLKNPGSRIAVIAPTYEAARDVCIEGDSGLLYCLPQESVGSGWNRSLGELTLTNGTIYKIYTSEKPDRLRGPQFHRGWLDELPSFKYPKDTWDMYQMALRLGKHPQSIITTTPKPIKLIRELIAAKSTYLVTGTTYDNKDNLPESFIHTILAQYEGTRLGEQELYAKVLEDVPGALWSKKDIEKARVLGVSPEDIAKKCLRVVVAIDPAVTSGADSDHTGIIAAGITSDGKGYVLADESCKTSPKDWATTAIRLLKRFGGDRIIGETNNGGDMIEDTLRSIDDTIPFKKVVASRGKFIRAEPISSLYEQGRVSHVGVFEDLEDEMCTFTVDNVAQNSPDRCDALVYALTDLFSGAMTFGALAYIKDVQEAAKVERIGKVMTSKMTKPAMAAQTPGCPACQSTAVVKLMGDFRCNQCGHVWGGPGHMPLPLANRTEFLKGLL